MPAVQSRRWTAAEVRALPDELDGRLPSGPEESADPLLVVEVLSASTARYDRGVKRDRYQRAGTEYWIVDVDARVVERWLPDVERPDVLRDELRWHPAGAAAPLVIALAPLFAEAHGER